MISRWSDLWGEVSGRLLRWRWQIALLLAMTDSVVELADHWPRLPSNPGFLVFAVIVPVFLGIVLTGVARAQSQMLQARNDAQEEERRQLARELHDSLGQQLAYLQLKLEQLTADDAAADLTVVRREMQYMRSMVKEANSLVRSSLRDLDMPLPADLITALHEHAQTVGERAGFKVSFSSKGPDSLLALPVQRHIINIVRESLTNIERHAHARHVALDLTWTDHSLSIRLADDGTGFEPSTVSPQDHLGMAFMHDRAEHIGAHLDITSCPGRGTELTLLLPFNERTRPIKASTLSGLPANGQASERAQL